MKRIWEGCECLAWGRRDSGRTLSVCINSLLVGGSEDRHGLFPVVPCARARGNVYKWKPGNSISNKENTYYGVQEVFGQCFHTHGLIFGWSHIEQGVGHDYSCWSLLTWEHSVILWFQCLPCVKESLRFPFGFLWNRNQIGFVVCFDIIKTIMLKQK